MRAVLRQIFPKRYRLAVAAGCVMIIVGTAIMELADLPDAWGWAVLLISLFAASFLDREDFYGSPPRERR